MYGYIYLTTNLITNKIYIGQKKNYKFLGNKYLGSGKHLKESVKNYGKESFSVELLCECYSKEELDEKEIYYIDLYDSTNPLIGYNISHGGNTPSGIDIWNKGLKGVQTMSLETRDKMSKSHIGHETSQETRNKISKSNKGKKRTEDQNLANSLRNKNKRWITNGSVQKTVKLEDLDKFLLDGWKLGRLKNKVPGWNKGLTKETSESVARYNKSRKDKIDNGIRIGFVNCPGNHFSKGQKINEYIHDID